jgi:NADH-quinone oxidoreductase subunit M
MGSLGLPGLGDFVGEFLVLLGAWRASRGLTIAATLGVLAATFYALRMVQQAFQGPNVHQWALRDLRAREAVIFASMAVALVWLGLFPQPVLNAFSPTIETLESASGMAAVR